MCRGETIMNQNTKIIKLKNAKKLTYWFLQQVFLSLLLATKYYSDRIALTED